MAEDIRVFLVDDHEIVRRGLRDVLADAGLSVVGEAGTARDAIGRIMATRPTVAVLDVRLPDGDGVSLCREVRSQCPETRCLMLTSYDDDEALAQAAVAGAHGYLVKRIAGPEFVQAVRDVGTGRQLLDADTVRRALARLERSRGDAAWRTLTAQEQRILALIADGYTNREIADELSLAEKTVKNYVSTVLGKLGMHRRTEAAVYADRLRSRSHVDRGT